jgi:pyruvate dehydrogenase E1 component
MTIDLASAVEELSDRDGMLHEIQKRVLWLSIYMVDYANRVRPNPSGLKVGGHQASSASVVTIMTYLFFEYMKAGDRISVKPHASPVYHAIQYLLGNLDAEYLKMLRSFHGLQAYPSRTKDPDSVDFTTGSVGLGAVAPNFAWITEEYVRCHMRPYSGPDRRFISLVGDAELDEGVVWEAIADPALANPNNVLWVVDLNRQSLDRIIPGIRVKVWREMFAANGWKVIDAKYGKRLQAAFEEPKGHLLRTAIDDMSNELYQRLLRVDPTTLREWLPRTSDYPDDMARLLGRWDDEELQRLFRNLGGHDLEMLRESFAQVDLAGGPNVVFAYTLKGWMLPSIGDPQNHSVNLNAAQMEEIRNTLGIDEDEVTARLGSDTPAGRLCLDTGYRLQAHRDEDAPPPQVAIPLGFGRSYSGRSSTQQVFGLVLTEIARSHEELYKRLVTVSPDVASSTNLGGWINKAGVWTRNEGEGAVPDDEETRALQWVESAKGQHIELGLSENNLFMCLGQLGLSYEMNGELLFPIGTLYDPFVRRGLDAFMFSIYSGSRFIVVGTPSGLTLGPEGGSHQSQITPTIGVELADLAFYEPCFGQELEWIILSALESIRRREESTYLRLTTKPADQGLFRMPSDPAAVEKLRRQVIAGAYRLVDLSGETGYEPGANVVNVFASGAIVPEAAEASRKLQEEGVFANVINVTGPGPLYSAFQSSTRDATASGGGGRPFLSDIIPFTDRSAPAVTVADGHPHGLAWIGAALATTTIPLGATSYGQSGAPEDLYREYGIDASSIMAACYHALGM